MTYERGKWEQMARTLAALVREQEQLEYRLTAIKSMRAIKERALWAALDAEPEQAPVLRGVDIGRPAGSKLRWCALKDCEVQGAHGHGVDG